MEQQSSTAKSIIICLVEGRSLKSVAVQLKVSPAAILNEKRQLGRRLLEFMGVDVVVECSRPPRWKNNLNAINEKMACREERKS